MKKTVEDVLALQQIDMRIRALNIKLATIPVERAKLVKEFDDVCDALDDAKTHLLNIEKQQKQQAAITQSLQENHHNLQIKSGGIKKVAEYQAIMADLATAKVKISDSETKELELMDEQEKAKEQIVQAERHYRAVGRLAQKEVRELDALKVAIQKEIIDKKKHSEILAARIPASTLDTYRRMLATGKGTPVGRITNGTCPNCSMKLPPHILNEAHKGNLIFCDSCSFYLYDPDPKED